MWGSGPRPGLIGSLVTVDSGSRFLPGPVEMCGTQHWPIGQRLWDNVGRYRPMSADGADIGQRWPIGLLAVGRSP